MSIANIKQYKFDKIDNGHANGVDDFFNKIVKPQFSNKQNIIKTHNTLMEYLNFNEKVLFLRLYGSYPKDKYHLLRRGFLTEYPNKTRMAFCDNTFSMLFSGLKIANLGYTAEELKQYLFQENLICSFLLTSEERELCYYKRDRAINVNLNSKGWYLAHIKPAGTGFYNRALKYYFPNPSRNEWDSETKIRQSKTNLDGNELNILKAHFIRLIHPLNSFLVPKKTHLSYSGKNIGEEIELLSYTQKFLKDEFPIEYEEFNKLTLEYNFPAFSSRINEVKWFKDKVVNEVKETLNDTVQLKRTLPKKMDDRITRREAIFLLNEKEINLHGLRFHCVNINSEKRGEKAWFVTVPVERFDDDFFIICNHKDYLQLIYIEKNFFKEPETYFTIRPCKTKVDIYIGVNSLIDLNSINGFNFNKIGINGESYIKKINK